MSLARSPFVGFHLRRFVFVFGLTFVFALGSAALGRYLDMTLQTAPLFLISCLVLAFLLLQLVLLKSMKKMTQEYNDKHFKR